MSSPPASVNGMADDDKDKESPTAEPDDYVPDPMEEILIADLMKRFGWDRTRAIKEVRLL